MIAVSQTLIDCSLTVSLRDWPYSAAEEPDYYAQYQAKGPETYFCMNHVPWSTHGQRHRESFAVALTVTSRDVVGPSVGNLVDKHLQGLTMAPTGAPIVLSGDSVMALPI